MHNIRRWEQALGKSLAFSRKVKTHIPCCPIIPFSGMGARETAHMYLEACPRLVVTAKR